MRSMKSLDRRKTTRYLPRLCKRRKFCGALFYPSNLENFESTDRLAAPDLTELEMADAAERQP